MILNYRFLIAVLTMVIPLRATTSYSTFSFMQAGNPGVAFTSVSFDPLGQTSYFPTLDLGGGLTFSGAGGLTAITTTINPGGSWPSGDILKGSFNGGEIDITLPAGTIAFGGSFGEVGGMATGITVTINSGGTFSYPLSPADTGHPIYLGLVSLSGFNSISIKADNSFAQLALNNFSYGTASVDPVPEPATMALIGSGLVILSVVRRRVRKDPRRPPNVEPFG